MSDEYLDIERESPLRNKSFRSPVRSSPSTTRRDYLSPKSPIQKVHKKEVDHITELFENTKGELKRTGDELRAIEEEARLRELRRNREHQAEVASISATAEELRERVRFLENQLIKTKAENRVSESKWEEKNEQLERSIDQLNIRLKDKEEQLRNTESLLETKSSVLQDRIQKLRDEIKALQREKDELTLTVDDYRSRALEEKEASLRLQRDLDSSQRDLQQLREEKHERTEAAHRLEQLKADNARLVKLLESTGQFDDFLSYIRENKGGIAFTGQGSGTVTFGPEEAASVLPVDAKTETKNWIPQPAYDLAKSFHARYIPNVNEDLFSELLHSLDEVWRKREASKIQALKAKHVEALRDLKRQLQHKQHYEDVVNLERIDHLKKELKKAKSPISRRYRAFEGSVLDTTLEKVDQLSEEVDTLKLENRKLKRLNTSTEAQEDALFLDGAAWFGRKALVLADKLGDKIATTVLDFQENVIRASVHPTQSPRKIASTQAEFLRDVEEAVLANRDKLRKLLQKVVRAIEEGETQLTVNVESLSDDEEDRLRRTT